MNLIRIRWVAYVKATLNGDKTVWDRIFLESYYGIKDIKDIGKVP